MTGLDKIVSKTSVGHGNNYIRIWAAPGEFGTSIAYASSEGSGEPAHPRSLARTSESRGTFRQKAISLAFLNGWACAVKICHDGMLEDTNSLDAPHIQMDDQEVSQ